MNKALGIGLLVVGIALVVFGINESNSFNSDVSRVFSGNPTDKSMWLLIGGIGAGITGLVLTTKAIKS
jgi:hypothetical protein